MKRSEWAKVVAIMQARWPRVPITPESANIWFDDLAEFPVEQVNAAVTAIYRDAIEWCPNGAQIRKKVLELDSPDRDWGKAYELAMRAAGPGGGAANGMAWLEKRDPLAAATARQFGWDDFCMSTHPESRRAQFRDLFKEVALSADRHDRYRGIEPAGLKALERGSDRPVRFGGLVELDEHRELGPGEAA